MIGGSNWDLDHALSLTTTAFLSAAERDIYTGDNLEIIVLSKFRVDRKSIPLRRD